MTTKKKETEVVDGGEITNASSFPCIYYAKHLETGLARYEYENGEETILIDGDNLKSMIPSFVGKPVYVHHQEVDLQNLKEQAHGYVTESFYNELDGWLWVKMLLVDDVAKQAVANGWSVSNAYIPTEWGAGGTHHNVPYDRRIVNGEFTHLAIVPHPRYEEAIICSPDEFKIYQESKRTRLAELQNSLTKTEQKGNPMFKFFKNTKQEVTTIDADTMIEIKNDAGEVSEVKISDMIETVLNAKKNEAQEEIKKEEEKINMDATVRVGDEDMTIGDLMNAYISMKNTKKNESEDGETEEEEVEEEKQNSAESDKTDHFSELKNARDNATIEVQTVDLGIDQLARGKQLYTL